MSLVTSGLNLPSPIDNSDLKRKVDEASKHVNIERLGIGPQCGFASTVAGNPLTADDMRAKLQLVIEASRSIGHD